ncbi:PIN domain-containing protein [Brevibacillus dissolubilis]|uniref:PIN domain-containing protein n=1 Tax=Brevibacillus dissolubilis TaxID=1844116 RepID=UPI0011167800|nr:PIN domain-containing protein [Brevibacillus dissolubilis]
MDNATVFVETNFLISLLYPHLRYKDHEAAKQLIERSRVGGYDLVIPFYSTFESLATTRRIKQEFTRWLSQMEAYQDNLLKYQIISREQMDVLHKVNEQMDQYSEQDFEKNLQEIIDQIDVVHIDERVLQLARYEISPLNIFTKGDSLDAYILASIIKRCEEIGPDSVKIFMSTNTEEFNKVPEELLNKHKLVYINNFNFQYGLKKWKEEYP